MMRLGLWGARGDRTGLANQTANFARNLPFERVLGISEVSDRSGDDDWRDYDADILKVVPWRDFNEGLVRNFCHGLDAVYSAETSYMDDVFPAIAREVGCRTVLHVNPEFWRYGFEKAWPRPDCEVAPTEWLFSHMEGVKGVLPTPVDTNIFQFSRRDNVHNVLHIIGHVATADRNGTKAVFRTAGLLHGNPKVTVKTQVPISEPPRGRINVECDDVLSAVDLYTGYDLILMPRRYGGQSLVVDEARAQGIPVIMLDRPPESGWKGVVAIPGRRTRKVRTPIGWVDALEGDHRRIAGTIRRLIEQPSRYQDLITECEQWIKDHSWDALRNDWLDVFKGEGRWA